MVVLRRALLLLPFGCLGLGCDDGGGSDGTADGDGGGPPALAIDGSVSATLSLKSDGTSETSTPTYGAIYRWVGDTYPDYAYTAVLASNPVHCDLALDDPWDLEDLDDGSWVPEDSWKWLVYSEYEWGGPNFILPEAEIRIQTMNPDLGIGSNTDFQFVSVEDDEASGQVHFVIDEMTENIAHTIEIEVVGDFRLTKCWE